MSSRYAALIAARLLVRIQQYRGIETRDHAPIRVLHDALGALVGARSEQHANHDIVRRTGGVLAQQLVTEARQPLDHLIGESQTRGLVAVARSDFGLLGHFADQARDEARLVDHAEIAEELDLR